MSPPKIIFDRRLGLAALAFSLYVALFVLVTYTLGRGMAIAFIIPVVAIAWAYGFRAGIFTGALSVPVNICMCMLMGLDWVDKFYVGGVGIAGTLIEVFIGAVVGKLHDYYQRIQDELDVRKVLEAELQELRAHELAQAEHTIKESEGRFKAIAENSPDAIIITDSKGIITYCNSAAEKMFAYRQEEMLGQRNSMLLPPQVRESETEKRQKYMLAGEGGVVCSTFESMAVRKDGTEFPIEFPFFSWKIDDETFYTAIIRDISERKRAENEIRQSHDYLETIFKASPDAILVGDAEGLFVMANQSVYDVYGYHPEELIGRHGSLLAPADETTRQKSAAMLNELFEKGVMRNYEIERKRKDGRVILVEASQVLLKNPDGSLAGSVSATRDITDRKKFEQELQQSRDYLASIFRASPDAFLVTDAEGYIVMANESVYDVYGYRPDEVIGQHVSIIVADDEHSMQRSVGMVEELFEAGFVRNFLNTRKRKDGRIIETESSVVLMKNSDGTPTGSISFSRDVTDRLKLEDRLRQSLAYLENIFRASPDALILADESGIIVMANESVFDIYGYRPEELIGQHGSILTPQDEQTMYKTMDVLEELYERGFVRNVELERRLKDGGTIWTEASYVLLKNPEGSVAGSVSVTRNITDRKRSEDQLRQSQKMEAIGTLAGGIAHDFNNILAVIMGYAELSKNLSEGNSVLENNLTQILKSVERAKALVRQILAFNRKTKGQAKPLHMNSVITEALKLLRALLPSTISMRADINETDDVVVADATEMYQIVMNLCTNAAYAMQSTGGIIELTLKPVDLDAVSAGYYTGIGPGPYVQLSVKDTGMGISRDILGRIFEPFFTTKEVGRGTGMGLAVVHGIVKSCKGDIKVYSEPGKGAVFHIVLPRVQSGKVEDEAVEREAPRGTESVLLVDDETLLLDVGDQLLGSLGYRVTAIGSAVEALERFTKNPAEFDVVITDQTMPQLTGYELAQRLMGIRKDIPVILCTGYSDLVTAESATAAGIKAFVIKPLNRLTIAETVRKVLD